MNDDSGQYRSHGPAQVHDLHKFPLSGSAIEAKSLEIIDSEAGVHHYPPAQWEVVRRLIHTSADFELMKSVRFSAEAIDAGVAALRSGAKIFVDSNMIRSGLSLERLKRICPRYTAEDLVCHVSDPDIAAEALDCGLPRSLFAVRKAKLLLQGALAVFGNAPVALLELNRLIMEEHVKPTLVIAMPVGFVHVRESKEELMSLGVPFIAIEGRRGGSPLAVAAIHALCSLGTIENA